MSNMVISPSQSHRDEYTSDGFKKVFRQVDSLSKKVDEGFDTAFRHMDTIESSMNMRFDTLEGRFDKLEKMFGDMSSQIILLTKSINRLTPIIYKK